MSSRSRLVDARKAKGFTQASLAKFVGIAQATISRIETGDVTPDAAIAQKLMLALGVSLDDLVRVDEPANDDAKAS